MPEPMPNSLIELVRSSGGIPTFINPANIISVSPWKPESVKGCALRLADGSVFCTEASVSDVLLKIELVSSRS